jgi:hypothetical protein
VPQRRPCPPPPLVRQRPAGGQLLSTNKRWLFLLMSAFVLTAGAARASQTLSANKVLVNAARHSRDVQMQRHVNPHLIRRYRARTWRWQALTGSTRTHDSIRPSTKAVLRFWVRAAGRAYLKAINPPHKGAWLHGRLCASLPAPPRVCRPLVAGGTDVGRGARVPERARFQCVAEHGSLLWIDLTSFGGK